MSFELGRYRNLSRGATATAILTGTAIGAYPNIKGPIILAKNKISANIAKSKALKVLKVLKEKQAAKIVAVNPAGWDKIKYTIGGSISGAAGVGTGVLLARNNNNEVYKYAAYMPGYSRSGRLLSRNKAHGGFRYPKSVVQQSPMDRKFNKAMGYVGAAGAILGTAGTAIDIYGKVKQNLRVPAESGNVQIQGAIKRSRLKPVLIGAGILGAGIIGKNMITDLRNNDRRARYVSPNYGGYDLQKTSGYFGNLFASAVKRAAKSAAKSVAKGAYNSTAGFVSKHKVPIAAGLGLGAVGTYALKSRPRSYSNGPVSYNSGNYTGGQNGY